MSIGSTVYLCVCVCVYITCMCVYVKEGCYIVHTTPSSGTVTTDGYIGGRWAVGRVGYVCRVAEG